MKTAVRLTVLVIVLGAGAWFIATSFRNASQPPSAASPPELNTAPVRVYGLVEPAGREVPVSPILTGQVTDIYVTEGARVTQGQRLCMLENSVEHQEVRLAEAAVAQAQKEVALDLDELKRAKTLYTRKVDSEYKYTRAKLQQELEVQRLQVAKHQLQVAKAKYERTILRAPVAGMVYKCDIRLGETLSAGDNERIIMGSEDLWIRLQVESFWRDRVPLEARGVVFDADTRERLGTATILQRMPYMGRRDFRTEDTQERFDTKFQEMLAAFTPDNNTQMPLDLSVMVQFE